MEKNYRFVCMLLCVLFCAAATQAQEKLWLLHDGGIAIHHLDTEGAELTPATVFEYSEGSSNPYGAYPHYAMQASNGEVFAVTSEGGVNNYGTIVKITRNGIQKVRDLEYNQTWGLRITEGKDGFIYGVSPAALDYFIFRFRPDGSDYQYKHITSYGFQRSDLLTTSTGDVLGTTKFHLYKMKPDLSGVQNLYEYKKATGNVPIGELLQGPDGYLYGVTRNGGFLNYGVVYKIRPDGTGYQVLKEFDNTNGRHPDRGLALDAFGNLFGVTLQGGQFKKGVIFTLRADGTGFRVLHSFQSFQDHSSSGDVSALQLGSDGRIYGASPGYLDRRIFRFDPATAAYVEFGTYGGRFSIAKFFTSVQPVITLTQPKNNATNVVINPSVQVTPMPGTTYYTVELSKTPDFSGDVIVSTNTHHSIHFKLTELLEYNTKYYARAKTSLWPAPGVTTSFTTRSPESFAFITKPADGTTNNPAPTLKVTANAVTGAKRYTIELSTQADFTSGVLSMTSAIDHQRTLIFEGLAFATKYFARMTTDISDYGRVTSFTTKAEPFAVVVDSETQNLTIDVHPNPTIDNFLVTNSSTSGHPMQVVITSMEGLDMGTYVVPPNEPLHVGDDFPKGIYLLRVVDRDHVTVKRLVKK